MWQVFTFNISHFCTYKTRFSGLISTNWRSVKHQNEKKLKIKKCQKCYYSICVRAQKIFDTIFGLFLRLFSAFHLKFLQLCKKPQSYICGTHQLLFPLVNNAQNWCQKLWRIFSPLLILQGECVTHVLITYLTDRSVAC